MKSGLLMQGSCEKCQKSTKNYENLLVFFENLQIYGCMTINTSLSVDFNNRRIILAQFVPGKYSSRRLSPLVCYIKKAKGAGTRGVCCWKLSIGEDGEDSGAN